MSEPSETPMMSQYRALKARDPDALLLFRMGDFYEMFGDDGVEATAVPDLSIHWATACQPRRNPAAKITTKTGMCWSSRW